MKHFFLLCACMAFGMMAQAQCTKSASTTAKTSCSSAHAATSDNGGDVQAIMASAAAQDQSIEKRVCEQSGSVSYVRKSVCSTSGKVSYSDVNYDAATAKFVNVSPSEKAACTKGASSEGKACCAGKATKASNPAEKKACCAGKTATSSCGSKASTDAKVQKVNN